MIILLYMLILILLLSPFYFTFRYLYEDTKFVNTSYNINKLNK